MKITIEFIGWHKDGCSYTGDTDHGPSFGEDEMDAFNAVTFYHMLDEGRIGAAFRGATDYSTDLKRSGQWEIAKQMGHQPRTEKYEATERIETGDGVLVRATFVPEPAESM